MNSRLATFALIAPLLALLTACAGVPAGSALRLQHLQNTLPTVNPAELRVALQVDPQIMPPPTSVPVLHVAIAPRIPGAFEGMDKQLPMRLKIAPASTLGLPPARGGRHWLIYNLSPESQAGLLEFQAYFKSLQAQGKRTGGGSMSVDIQWDELVPSDPAQLNTRWDSWLQTSRHDGFFKLWSGSLSELLHEANAAPQAASHSRP